MNKIFKTKKDRHGKTVVCSELSRSNGKLKSLVLAVAAIGVVPAAQASNVVWESSLSSVQNAVLDKAYNTLGDPYGNFLSTEVLKYHNAADIIKITDAEGAATDLTVFANSTKETTLNATRSNTLSLYRPGYTVTLDVPEAPTDADGNSYDGVSAYSATYTTDPSVLVIQDTDNTAEVISATDFLKVTPKAPVPNDATKGIGNHTTYTLDLIYDDTQFAVVDGKLSLANGVLGGGGDVPSTYFHVNNTTNIGGDTTTNLGAADKAAGATANYAIAAGVNTTAISNSTIAMGHGANAGISRPGVTGEMPTGDHAIAIGTNADAQSADTIAIGRNARVLFTEKETNVFAIPLKSIAIGADSKSQSEYSTAIGFEAIAGDNYEQSNATSVGARAKAININTVAVGSNANSSGTGSSALGVYSEASSNRATAVGFQSQATGDFGVALGAQADAAYLATATGTGAQATAEGATANGYRAQATGVNSLASARGAQATATNATALGRLAVASHENAVALGSGSTTREATSENTATVGGVTYSGFAGNTPKSVVSFGKAGDERQLVNVAAGNISATSTDAINGSQLYMVANQVSNLTSLVSNFTTTPTSTTQVINGDGSVTVTPNATNTNVYEITVNTDGQTIGKVTAEDVAKDPTLTEGALKVITTPLTVNNSTGAVNTPANPNAMATAGDIANAINGSGFTLTAQGANGSLVNPGETVDMKNTDGNIVISKSADSNDVVYNLANDVKVGNSVTTPKVNADAVTIGNVANPSAPSTTLTTVAGGNYNSAGQLVDDTATPALSVGGNQITNVANGAITPTSTDAINGSQLYALGSNINNKIDQVAGRVEQIGKQADRGAAIAGAIGMLPQPHLPGKSLVAVATTRYRGQQAAAIGYSRLSDNGKHIIKVSGSTGVNSGAGGRSTMVGAAYGYQW